MAQSPPAGTLANRFVAVTVFGVVVWYLNVTVLLSPFDHAPSKVQMRKIFFADATFPKMSGDCVRLPASTVRTTREIRSAAGRVNTTRSVRADFPSGRSATNQSSYTVTTTREPSTAAVAA